MILSEYQRLYEDNSSIGALFFAAIDELHDTAFHEALALIISAIFDAIHKAVILTESDQDKLVNTFISAIPPSLTNRLNFSA